MVGEMVKGKRSVKEIDADTMTNDIPTVTASLLHRSKTIDPDRDIAFCGRKYAIPGIRWWNQVAELGIQETVQRSDLGRSLE